MVGYPETTLRSHWWESVSSIARPWLKLGRKEGPRTLNELTAQLDHYKARGVDALEIFAPCKGGVCYQGLDTLDYYQVDPEIGSLDDFKRLVDQAHARGMAVIAFHNLGYGHEQFPAFLKACDDVRAGVESDETRMFLWSDTGQDMMDRSLAPHFMNDLHGNWRWSERAGKYFWVKWEGERGGYHLPQFNFGDPGWQAETRRIVEYWLQTGIDGMVIDAVNWYINCNWEITRQSMTGALNAAGNQFSQPEGAGGFDDDPVPWISQGGFNCVMDYSIKKWWEGRDLVREALLTGDARPIEAALAGYRDRVTAAGGICYIDPPNLEDLPAPQRLLGAALVATMGELLLLTGNQVEELLASGPMSEYAQGLHWLLETRRRYPALCAAGERRQAPTQDDARFYVFLRGAGPGQMLVASSFQPAPHTMTVSCAAALRDVRTEEVVQSTGGKVAIHLDPYGFRIFELVENRNLR